MYHYHYHKNIQNIQYIPPYGYAHISKISPTSKNTNHVNCFSYTEHPQQQQTTPQMITIRQPSSYTNIETKQPKIKQRLRLRPRVIGKRMIIF